MTNRTRLIYSKRGGACFVPHIALAQIFSRSALRAGLELVMTQGFSPRAKISFAPELPAGVIALNEPVDMFFTENYANLVDLLNNSLPEGFNISRAYNVPDESPSLGKMCKAAHYLVRLRNNNNIESFTRKFYQENIIEIAYKADWLNLIISEPAQNPIGGLVKNLVHENIITGWQDINIVREAIGLYENGRVRLYA
ncbi:MAG: DUF2344 domain-containing protein [Synergistaceae bacterium]|nr:DUF2344 domain-containing protein [Synergistaceae bacterium]